METEGTPATSSLRWNDAFPRLPISVVVVVMMMMMVMMVMMK